MSLLVKERMSFFPNSSVHRAKKEHEEVLLEVGDDYEPPGTRTEDGKHEKHDIWISPMMEAAIKIGLRKDPRKVLKSTHQIGVDRPGDTHAEVESHEVANDDHREDLTTFADLEW